MAKPASSVAKTATAVANSAPQMPDFMKGKQSKGLNQIDQRDVEMPRVILLQGTHDQVNTFDSAVAGQFWHSVADISLGAELKIVVIMVKKSVKLWGPDGVGGLLAVSDDMETWSRGGNTQHTVKIKNVKDAQIWDTKGSVSESGLLEWGTSIKGDKDSQPAATLTYDLLVALPDFPDLGYAVITLSRSGMKPGRKFLGKLKIANAPSYGLMFKMTSKSEGEGQQSYFVPQFIADGFVMDQDAFNEYEAACDRFTKEGFEVKDDKPDEHGAVGSGDVAGANARTGGKI